MRSLGKGGKREKKRKCRERWEKKCKKDANGGQGGNAKEMLFSSKSSVFVCVCVFFFFCYLCRIYSKSMSALPQALDLRDEPSLHHLLVLGPRS